MDKYVEAEKRLAELTEPDYDWKTSEFGEYVYRSEYLGMGKKRPVVFPAYARDNEAAFLLMVEHGCYPHVVTGPHDARRYFISVGGVREPFGLGCDAESKEAAVRYAIVQAVIAKLEGEKK